MNRRRRFRFGEDSVNGGTGPGACCGASQMVEILYSVLRNLDFSGELVILISTQDGWETRSLAVSLWFRHIRTVRNKDRAAETEGIEAM